MQNDKDTHSLLPRRQEIVRVIKDHPYCSLDHVARKFPMVSSRMISYDVNYLVGKGFLIKHGDTRGTRYSVQPDS